MGGLGNQMFQYAMGRSFAIQNSQELQLDRTFLDDKSPREHFTFRNYELGMFNIKASFVTNKELEYCHNKAPLQRFLPFLKRYETFNEHMSQIPSKDQNSYKNVYLNGYWQNDFFFSSVENQIREDFKFTSEPSAINKEFIPLVERKNSISLHIRRGDYSNVAEIKNVHGLLPLNYYEKSVEYISKQIGNPHFFIFSDDIEWAKYNLDFVTNATFIGHNVGNNSFEDLRLMSLCHHNIIANSTFSWWGAWLNSNPTKIIVAPEKWFNDPTISSIEILPQCWIKF